MKNFGKILIDVYLCLWEEDLWDRKSMWHQLLLWWKSLIHVPHPLFSLSFFGSLGLIIVQLESSGKAAVLLYAPLHCQCRKSTVKTNLAGTITSIMIIGVSSYGIPIFSSHSAHCSHFPMWIITHVFPHNKM